MATPSLGPTGERQMFREEVKRVFLAVCDLDPIIQRKCVEAICGSNHELLREVERLLANDIKDSLFDTDITALPDEWIGKTLQNYKILERIGEGGMGVVYRGEDIRLKRQIVVKLLAARMAGDATQRERFLREAQAAAVLDHPSICTVFDIGEEGGRPYIVTAFLAGDTLERLMRRQRLSILQSTEFVIQLAEGLQAAHAKGILHRDLKPSNVIIVRETDRKTRATIIDFGLARVAWGNRLTHTGLLIGTATYICPELLLGHPIEEQSDIWSLGVMFFEMLAGRPPFDAENRERLFYLICNENTPMVTAVNPELPEEAARIVAKSLEKDVKRRYQNASSFLADLQELERVLSAEVSLPARRMPAAANPLQSAPAHTSQSRTRAIIHTRAIIRVLRNRWVLAAVVLAALTTGSWFAWTKLHPAPAPRFKRVAILPFEDLGTSERHSQLSRVVGDSLSVQLAGLSDVRMISDSLVRGMREKGASDNELRTQLHLDYLVTGSTLRSGDVLQVSVNLISAADDSVLWSKKMNLPWSGILKVQEQFAVAAVREIETKLAPSPNRFVANTNRADAHDSFLKARHSLLQFRNRAQPEFLQAAETRLWRALELEPGYVDAMVELAQVRISRLYPPQGDREVLLREATKLLNRALSIDSSHAKANSLMGSVYGERGDFLSGLAYARKAAQQAPGDAEIHYRLGRGYSALGFFESAILENEKALKLDAPLVWPFTAQVWYLVTLGRFKDTEAAIRNLQAFDSKSFLPNGAEALVQLNTGNYQKAREIYEGIQEEGLIYRDAFEIGAALARTSAGETLAGKAVLTKYEKAGIRMSDNLILLAAQVGDADTMVRMTRESTSYNNYGWMVRYPTFMKNIGSQPQFRKLAFDLYRRWLSDLAAEGENLPVRPPTLPTPEAFLASLR